jgi:integrase
MAGKKSGRFVERNMRRYVLPSWQGRLITDIDKRAARAVVDDIRDRGKHVLANRIFSHLHRMFVWCADRDIIKDNPLRDVKGKTKEKSRTRVLSDDELKKVWLASSKLSGPYRDAFRLLVLTGARKNEISKLRGEEVKGNDIHLEGDRTKNGEPHIIPLSSAAREVLRNVEKTSGYLFATRLGTHSASCTMEKAKLDFHSGVRNWTIHDLRRTVATNLQKLSVPLPVTEAVLGHSGGSRSGIVSVYQRHDYYPEKRLALEAWGAHVTALVEGSERRKVLAYGAR